MNSEEKRQVSNCKYCGTQIEWRDKQPFIAYTDERHRCEKFKKVKKAEQPVTDLALVQQVKDLRDEVNTLRTQISGMTKEKPSPTSDHEKRIIRLEGIVVELRNDRTAMYGLIK